MHYKKTMFLSVAAMALLASCGTSGYDLSSVSRQRILVDRRFDTHPDKRAVAFIAPYRRQVDSIMSPVVGEVGSYLASSRPESALSNLMADIMVWGGREFGEKPDFGIYNIGGIRAALAKGKVTYGDVVDLAPFENHICFVTLSGEKTLELFQQIAARGGEAVSHGVNLVITHDGKLVSASVNGQPVNSGRSYRIATIDYVAQGNDDMRAFKSAENIVAPQDQKYDSRFVIMDYFREQTAHGIVVNPKTEGRIVFE